MEPLLSRDAPYRAKALTVASRAMGPRVLPRALRPGGLGPAGGGGRGWRASPAAACSAGGQAAAALELTSVQRGQDRLQDVPLAVEVVRAPVERVDLRGVTTQVAVGRHAAAARQLAQLAEGERVDAELIEAERVRLWAPASLPVDQLDLVAAAEDRVDAPAHGPRPDPQDHAHLSLGRRQVRVARGREVPPGPLDQARLGDPTRHVAAESVEIDQIGQATRAALEQAVDDRAEPGRRPWRRRQRADHRPVEVARAACVGQELRDREDTG